MSSTTTPETAAAAVGANEQATKAPVTFTTLPADIRLLIYDWVFYSTTLEAEQDTTPPEPHVQSAAEIEADRVRYKYGDAGNLFLTPDMPVKLNLVCKLLNEEIRQSWHGKVAYSFPSTMAFVDVLSQWSEQKIGSVRHIHVVATPLPLHHINHQPDYYSTHFVKDAPPIFVGLKLDLLTVENIWLAGDGEPVDGWCLEAVWSDVYCLLAGNGWKEFRYLSGALTFSRKRLQDLKVGIADIMAARGETRYWFEIEESRPWYPWQWKREESGAPVKDYYALAHGAELREWDAQHPHYVAPTEPSVQVRAKRGTSEYAQSGEQKTDVLRGLLEGLGWLEMREDGTYLVDDGCDDPTAHL